MLLDGMLPKADSLTWSRGGQGVHRTPLRCRYVAWLMKADWCAACLHVVLSHLRIIQRHAVSSTFG